MGFYKQVSILQLSRQSKVICLLEFYCKTYICQGFLHHKSYRLGCRLDIHSWLSHSRFPQGMKFRKYSLSSSICCSLRSHSRRNIYQQKVRSLCISYCKVHISLWLDSYTSHLGKRLPGWLCMFRQLGQQLGWQWGKLSTSSYSLNMSHTVMCMGQNFGKFHSRLLNFIHMKSCTVPFRAGMD